MIKRFLSWLRRLYRWLKAARLLSDLEQRLATQDNRATAWPLYVVEEEERIYGMDPEYAHEGTDYIWSYCDDPEYSHDTDGDLRAEHPDETWEDLDSCSVMGVETKDGQRYEKIYYLNRWKFVCAHLTANAANAYIKQNRHNLRKPRVYVTSQYRCYEWQDVVRILGGIDH